MGRAVRDSRVNQGADSQLEKLGFLVLLGITDRTGTILCPDQLLSSHPALGGMAVGEVKIRGIVKRPAEMPVFLFSIV